jgi:hypothetical protein
VALDEPNRGPQKNDEGIPWLPYHVKVSERMLRGKESLSGGQRMPN